MNQANDDKNDERTPCKYGASCYQKNKAHLEKYKHPSNSDQHEEKDKRQGEKPSSANSVLKQQKLNIFFKKKVPIAEKDRKVEKLNEEKNEKTGNMRPTKNETSPFLDVNTTENCENTCASSYATENCENKRRNRISPSLSPSPANDLEKVKGNMVSPSLSVGSLEKFENSVKDEIASSSSSNASLEKAEKKTSSPYAEITEKESKVIVKKLFLVDMPEDFYSFWSFCKRMNPKNPREALSSIDLTLVGPYDVLAGALKEDSVTSSEALIHWRYYYDPPEFQTVIKSSKDGFHMGYFRDDPNMAPVFVAYNSAEKNPLVTPIAENMFGAVDWYMSLSEKASNPFKKVKTSNLKSMLHDWAKKHNFTLEKYSSNMQKRNKAVVCKSFQQVGIVVPYDKKTELGYRPLSENTKNLKNILDQIVKAKTKEERTAHFNSLHSVVNWANIAMDEGDFGTNLELGLDLFSYDTDEFNSIIRSCLETAYNLLGRQQFAAILQAHLDNRRKGSNLSVIENNKKE